MKEIKRVSAGVMFESDVLLFIDQLASAQQRNRSFIINSIIRYYSRMIQASPASTAAADALATAAPAPEVTLIRF